MKQCVTIVCCLLFFFPAKLSAQQLIFKNYTAQDGLVANPVRCIFQDSMGFLWIGTWEGLCKYDGHRFLNFTTANGLSHSVVNDVYEARGNIYVAENNGALDLIRSNALQQAPVSRNIIINKFIPVRNKVLLATDQDGICEFVQGRIVKPSQELPGNNYTACLPLNDSQFVATDIENGALYFLNRQYKQFRTAIPVGKQVYFLYKDSRQRIWMGTSGGLKQLILFTKNDTSVGIIYASPPFNSPPLNKAAVMDMLEDQEGNYWIGTMEGLVRVAKDGATQVFTDLDGLPSSIITCLFQDRQQNIWIGTAQGLSKLVNQTQIRIYKKEHGLISDFVGGIWPLNETEMLVIDGNAIGYYNHRQHQYLLLSKGSDSVMHAGFIRNSVPPTIYSTNGLYEYNVARKAVRHLPIYTENEKGYFCTAIDSTGTVFVSSLSGLKRCYAGGLQMPPILPVSLSALVIDRKGYLWAGSIDGKLYRVKYSSTGKDPTVSIQNYSRLIDGKSVRSLFEDSRGNIWVGTRYDGAFRISNTNGGEYSVMNIRHRHGLMSDWIRTFAEDKHGTIWVGSHVGIDKLVPVEDSFRVFNFSKINNFFQDIVTIKPAADGTIWCGSYHGLVAIRDGQLERTSPFPVHITYAMAGSGSNQRNLMQQDSIISLPHYQNHVQFEFSAPDFINEQQNLYSYRLQGSEDTTWSAPAHQQNIAFASLRPGQYRFEVRTLGWNNQWGAITACSFFIHHPFWEQWWFIALIAAVLIGLLYGLYRYRIQQLTRLQQVRNRIATDLHDDIGSALTNISILSTLSNKHLEQPQEAEKFLRRITEEVTDSGQALDDIIWSVNSNNDTLEETMARMRRYASELFENSDIALDLQFDEGATGKKLNMEQRRDVYLIYKESLSNIHRHAAAKKVWIRAGWQHHCFELAIKDDGHGFRMDQPSHRNGLKNIRSRVEKWKGTFRIESAPGQGTGLYISLPL